VRQNISRMLQCCVAIYSTVTITCKFEKLNGQLYFVISNSCQFSKNINAFTDLRFRTTSIIEYVDNVYSSGWEFV